MGAIAALAMTAATAGAASHVGLGQGTRCSPVHETYYQHHGFACVEAKGGGHRLAPIVAEPARRPPIPRHCTVTSQKGTGTRVTCR